MWTANGCEFDISNWMLLVRWDGVDPKDFEVMASLGMEILIAAEVEGRVGVEEGFYGGGEGCAVALIRGISVEYLKN